MNATSLTGALTTVKLQTMANDDSVRLDIWLDVACLFKSRSQAQSACRRGRVEVNGDHGKPHRALRPGDRVVIRVRGGGRRTIEVVELQSTHVSKARARELYIDHTPPPTPEEVELRRMQRLSTPEKRPRGAGAPKKRERRELRRLKEELE
jgi:ribosome-associated heat shock protein Hsp15